MIKSIHDRHNRPAREKACRKIAEAVGMSCALGADGWDAEIVSLADQVYFDKTDMVRQPLRVAREITAMLDSKVRNP